MSDALITLVDALLPQTQCGLCGHEEGCLPYATSMVNDAEATNKCVPGGQPVADGLAELLNREKLPAEPSKWAIQANGRPQEVRAVIIEDDCIGCTKCIAACPVDAIVGSGKLMHTVFTDLCTGCELCLPPCPVDCIELVPIERTLTTKQRQAEQDSLRSRYQAHIQRLTKSITASGNHAPVVNAKQARITQQHIQVDAMSADTAKQRIQAAKLRTQIKKLQKQLAVRPNDAKQNQLDALENQLALLDVL